MTDKSADGEPKPRPKKGRKSGHARTATRPGSIVRTSRTARARRGGKPLKSARGKGNPGGRRTGRTGRSEQS